MGSNPAGESPPERQEIRVRIPQGKARLHGGTDVDTLIFVSICVQVKIGLTAGDHGFESHRGKRACREAPTLTH